jgi:SAM-dependent methyltransferase/uncharacterized protein YbaR (Trm112 family)
MKPWLMTHLCCIECGSRQLESYPFDHQVGDTTTGVVRCRHCGRWYPVINRVPRMLPAEMLAEQFGSFSNEFQSQLADLGCAVTADSASVSAGGSHKQQTSDLFGFEWKQFDRFGWDDSSYSMDNEERVFPHKTLFRPEDLKGRLVLDAGSGNGRYSFIAAKYGAHVIGVDFSSAVEVAAANTRDIDQIQIVQADVFRLPFPTATFDMIFSIGVLMHTGDASGAVRALVRHLKKGGEIAIHVYGRGNPIYEYTDRTLREKTTRMSIEDLSAFTKRLYRLTMFLETIKLRPLAACFVQVEPHQHFIFDWYGAPLATHHSFPEVEEWFRSIGLTVTATNEADEYISPTPWKRPFLKLLHAPRGVTVRGKLPA